MEVKSMKFKSLFKNISITFYIVLLLLTSFDVYALPSPDGFPIPSTDKITGESVAVKDIDKDGINEIILISDTFLEVYKANGDVQDGFPADLGEKTAKDFHVVSSPSIGDLDLDGKDEIIVSDMSGYIHAFSSNGEELSGFPVKIAKFLKTSPTLEDIDNDRKLEIIIGTADRKLFVLENNGKIKKGFPKKFNNSINTNVSVGDLNLDGSVDLVFGVGGSVYAVNSNGKLLKGFPFRTNFKISSQPVLADLDGNGKFEVIVGSQDFNIYAISNKGKLLKGFPFKTNYRIYGSPAIADIDSDNDLEIVIGSNRIGSDAKGEIFVIDSKGKSLKGFPIGLKGNIHSSPVIGDLDSDGRQEIVITTKNGMIYTLRDNGKMYPGFPKNQKAFKSFTPYITDLNNDKNIAIIIANNKMLTVWMVPKRNSESKFNNLQWSSTGHDVRHTGRYYPNQVHFKNMKISPKNPNRTTKIEINYDFFTLDNMRETNTQIRWYKNGKNVSGLKNKKSVSPGMLKKEDKWQCTVQGWENFKRWGEKGKLTEKTKSKIVVVKNLPPNKATISLSPIKPKTKNNLQVNLIKESSDYDGDKVSYKYRWYKNGNLQSHYNDITNIKSEDTSKGDKWKVEVIPTDGENDGEAVSSNFSVINTPPGRPELEFNPEKPSFSDSISVSIKKESKDSDFDSITYKFKWYINGKEIKEFRESSVLDAFKAKRGSKVRVEAIPFDGEQNGIKGYADVLITNSPPTSPEVAIIPNMPNTKSDLKVKIITPGNDPDGDKVKYKYMWFKNGDKISGSNAISSKSIKKNETWTVKVIPTDGSLAGYPSEDSVTIMNLPPTKPNIMFSNKKPFSNQNVSVNISKPSYDRDGDKITLRYRWYKNGNIVDFSNTKSKLVADDLFKGDSWKVEVVPFDGEMEGEMAIAELKIKNAPPGPPKISISPEKIFTTDIINVEIIEQSRDIDEDSIQYIYSWYKNGKSIKLDKTAKNFNSQMTKKGDVIKVVVTPYDGDSNGSSASKSTKIINSTPTAPSINLASSVFKSTEKIVANITDKGFDPDGDNLSVLFTWLCDGKKKELPSNSSSINIGMTRKNQNWKLIAYSHDGISKGDSSEYTFSIINSEPTSPKISISPKNPTTMHNLNAKLISKAVDPDGDNLTYKYTWYNNDQEVISGLDKGSIKNSDTYKGQTWKVEVRAFDGEIESTPVLSEVTIKNLPPKPPKIKLSNIKPTSIDELECLIEKDGIDPDGDSLSYVYEWYKNGKKAKKGDSKITSSETNKGDIWKCNVRSDDGELKSGVITAETKILNIAPTAPVVLVEPSSPKAGENVSCVVGSDSIDMDGDKVKYSYTWYTDGKKFSSSNNIKAKKKGALLKCEVTPTDGENRGDKGYAEAVVINSEPTAPKISISPKNPTTMHNLISVIRSKSTDIDNDKIIYRYTWYKDGIEVISGEDKNKIVSSETLKGHTWKVQVRAFDGEVESKPEVAEVKIKNLAPKPPILSINPSKPITTDDLNCIINKDGIDKDGDSLSYDYQWFKNGKSINNTSNVISASETKKGDKWKCQVRSFDGEIKSNAVSFNIVIINSKPTAPVVTINPDTAYTNNNLECLITSDSFDSDNDNIKYSYYWYKNAKKVNLNSNKINNNNTKTGDEWYCKVIPSDGSSQGEESVSQKIEILPVENNSADLNN